jgi:DNA polymerase I-like protein with 3'-5' exonuclease and polymerase domains
MSDIKACFPSRFENGVLLEADFSQLEVVGLALLTWDEALIEDLLSGMDTHRFFASKLYNKPETEVTKAERTLTKKLTFQLQYGSGAAGMARKLQIDKAIAQSFIDAYYTRYQRVRQWQEEVAEAVRASRKPTERLTKAGRPRGIGQWDSPTGRVYAFLEDDPPEWMKDRTPNFSPTQMKNYPVQGIATADIMAVFRALLYRRLLGTPLWKSVRPINTVHDSVMFDCKTKEDALQLDKELQEVAATLPEVMMEMWGVPIPVPFSIESKIGPRWSELEELNGS